MRKFLLRELLKASGGGGKRRNVIPSYLLQSP